jgi:hypothetical protein
MIRRKYIVSQMSSGSAAKVTSARRKSRTSSTIAITPMTTMSPKIATTPCVTMSVSASMSFVIRVISLPTGLRSKKVSESPWRCAKSCTRRSYMAFCPT